MRVFVKGINVIEFLEWYNSKEDREISPWREFCEELISTDILHWKYFRFIDYKFKHKVDHHSDYELEFYKGLNKIKQITQGLLQIDELINTLLK